ncbi:hypothetical protein [Sedimentitalea sp.]|uniref:hypothetical protein n=1 Tax=Sedimentitalea sp. TaxID=2048915 RepID=UPI003298159C
MQDTRSDQNVLALVATALERDDGVDSQAGDAWLELELGRAVKAQKGLAGPAVLSRDDLSALGKRIARRLTREACKLLCGEAPEDKEDRKTLGLDDMTVIGAITAVLVSGLGIAPGIAAIVAALIFRRLAEPTLDELCQHWRDRLATVDALAQQ